MFHSNHSKLVKANLWGYVIEVLKEERKLRRVTVIKWRKYHYQL